MATNPDFSDMLAALSVEGASFLLVGGHAVMHYTEPRYTKDLDLWVKPDPENAERVFREHAAWIPSPEILVRNKRASGRPQDLLDVAALERALARR